MFLLVHEFVEHVKPAAPASVIITWNDDIFLWFTHFFFFFFAGEHWLVEDDQIVC